MLLGLCACGPRLPDSGADQSYGAALDQATSAAQGPGNLGTSGAEDPNRPRGGDAPAGIASVQSELEYDANGNRVSVPPENRAAISDEQNFDAVKSRVSIEQDAARLAQQRAQYQVIQPGPLPPRPAGEVPNLADYALSTNNAVGEKLYKRFSVFGKDAYDRACARFTSADLAQEAFLRRGGPERDPLGIDPDGDGFACDWDPAPFRRVTP